MQHVYNTVLPSRLGQVPNKCWTGALEGNPTLRFSGFSCHDTDQSTDGAVMLSACLS